MRSEKEAPLGSASSHPSQLRLTLARVASGLWLVVDSTARTFLNMDLLASDSAPRHDAAATLDHDARPWYKLGVPGTVAYPWFPKPAQDPLTCWPDVYNPTSDTPAWASALTNWESMKSYRCGVLSDTGFNPATVNYAFNNLINHIPSSGYGGVCGFGYEKGDAFLTKQNNFYGALCYIQQYPIVSRMTSDLGFGKDYYYRQVEPTIWSVARHIDFLDWKLRLWDFNHTVLIPERVLTSFDGFPITVRS